MGTRSGVLSAAAGAFFMAGCGAETISDSACGEIARAGAAHGDPAGNGAICEKLSSYRVLVGTRSGRVFNAGFVPYDLNTPLFSDYAVKARAIYVPPGQSGQYDAADVFAFPAGTIIAKTFAYPADFRRPDEDVRWLETRLLIRRADGWRALPYVWDDTGTEAFYTPLGARIDLTWIHHDGSTRRTNYVVPDLAECKECHSRVDPSTHSKVMEPIGPKAKHLNRDFVYPDGPMNQLTKLATAGFLSGVPADPSQAARLAVWDDPATGDLDTRARAYLDANCAHCHNPRGTAAGSGLMLGSDVTEPGDLGLCKPPTRGIGNAGNIAYDVVPGNPDASGLLLRMGSQVPKERMPRLGRTVVHTEGVALIREWIAALDPADVNYACGTTTP